MTRRFVPFTCDGAALCGTLDIAPATGATGLLLVSGGNEIRAGSWAGQAQLAARLAAAGVPVFRFDRRGVGDSEGVNRGFRESRDDIAAALAAFRDAAPHLRRVVGLGNCDAASALALFGAELGLDALVLANPWTLENDEPAATLPAGAIRARYLAKLASPREVLRLLTGGVNLAKLAQGLRAASRPAQAPSSLVEAMKAGLSAFTGPVHILLATHDRTAQLFEAAWPRDGCRIARIDSASHSFSDHAAREWLFARLIEATA